MKTKTLNIKTESLAEDLMLGLICQGIRENTLPGESKYKVVVQVREIKNGSFNRRRTDLQKAKDTLWKLVSEYVRRRDDGQCFTCPTKKQWKEMQAGHFIPQSLCNTDFKYMETNVHCQCYRCNINESGNVAVYRVRIDEKYGFGTAEMMEEQNRQKIAKWTLRDYEQAIRDYRKKLAELGN